MRKVLRNRDEETESSVQYFARHYDEDSVSDDEEIAPEKEEPLCPNIYLVKA